MNEHSHDDMILIDRYRLGDRYAADELFVKHYPAALMYSLKMTKHVEEASDVVAEGFIRINRSINLFQGNSSFSTWMYRILRNCFLDCRKKKRIQANISLDALIDSNGDHFYLQPADPRESPCEVAIKSEFRSNVQLAVKKLTVEEQDLIHMYHDQDLSYSEIAEILGKPAGTVKSRLHRARANFELATQRTGCNLDLP